MTAAGTKAIIYDCDGVMFDSFEANFSFYARVLVEFGKPLPDRGNAEAMTILHTWSHRDVLAYLFVDDPRKDDAIRFAGTINYADLVPMMVMEDGFLETVRMLEKGYALGICTNRSTSMDLVLDTFGLRPYFRTVMTSARVANPKPHPEPLLKTLDDLEVQPHEALFIGDSEVDRRAAEAAGVPFIAYRNDLPCIARLERHADLPSLITFLESPSGRK